MIFRTASAARQHRERPAAAEQEGDAIDILEVHKIHWHVGAPLTGMSTRLRGVPPPLRNSGLAIAHA